MGGGSFPADCPDTMPAHRQPPAEDPLDFIFMLTRADRTVDDCLEVLEEVAGLGLSHIGFKDVGVAPDRLATLMPSAGPGGESGTWPTS